MDSNLPVPQNDFLSELGVSLPPPILVSSTATYDETLKADIQLFNVGLTVLYAMWGEVKTFSAAMTMIDKTLTMIEKRRAILGHPYGSAQNKSSSPFTYEPLS